MVDGQTENSPENTPENTVENTLTERVCLNILNPTRPDVVVIYGAQGN